MINIALRGIRLGLAVGAALAALCLSAQAQLDFSKAEEEAALVKTYVDLLETADPHYKAILIRDGLGETNPEIKRIAFETALSSSDTNLKNLAIRQWIGGRQQIIVRLIPAKMMSAEQKALHEKYSGALDVKNVAVSENGEIRTNFGDGNFVDGGFQLSGYGCFLSMTETAETLLSGSYNCGKRGELAAQIDLQ